MREGHRWDLDVFEVFDESRRFSVGSPILWLKFCRRADEFEVMRKTEVHNKACQLSPTARVGSKLTAHLKVG